MPCIYRITNLINGKSYIGLTTRTAEHRFRKHKSMLYTNGCSTLYNAMKKYGADSFIIETIFSSDDIKKVIEAEQFFITLYGTLSPKGYNLTTGGENCIVSEETKAKIRNSLKGRSVTWGDEVSKSVKKLWENPTYREQQIKQRHQKRGKYREGIVKPLRLNIPIEDVNKMYQSGISINKISKELGVSFGVVKRRLI